MCIYISIYRNFAPANIWTPPAPLMPTNHFAHWNCQFGGWGMTYFRTSSCSKVFVEASAGMSNHHSQLCWYVCAAHGCGWYLEASIIHKIYVYIYIIYILHIYIYYIIYITYIYIYIYVYCHATNIQQPQCLRVFTSASRDTTRTGQVSRLKVICHVSYASKYPGNLAVCGTVTSISSAQKGREMLRKSRHIFELRFFEISATFQNRSRAYWNYPII